MIRGKPTMFVVAALLGISCGTERYTVAVVDDSRTSDAALADVQGADTARPEGAIRSDAMDSPDTRVPFDGTADPDQMVQMDAAGLAQPDVRVDVTGSPDAEAPADANDSRSNREAGASGKNGGAAGRQDSGAGGYSQDPYGDDAASESGGSGGASEEDSGVGGATELPVICSCQSDGDPVCSVDGTTYGAECAVFCSISIACNHACPCEDPCTVTGEDCGNGLVCAEITDRGVTTHRCVIPM